MTVARLAKGLGMAVVAMDPFASQAVASAASVTLVQTLQDLLPLSDFLTIHTPLIASTKGMISSAELKQMKKGSRILNVARGGMIDELALLEALEDGHLAGAGIDVFTSEPPTEDSSAAKLIAHPRVIATPHLGASTVEAQENVSIDVCEQVLSILKGDLPRSAVNAPLILPEEYKRLQPFVKLVEKMGSLYTQYYSSSSSKKVKEARLNFDLVYEGEVAGINNTKPLFAALIKGLVTPISSSGINVNIVNAELIAKERGIVVNEQHSRDPMPHTYSSLVTLWARAADSGSRPPSSRPTSIKGGVGGNEKASHRQQIISGYCSDAQIFISQLGRFATSFVPDGPLLIAHNYDSPGQIGVVGSILGKQGVNIRSMTVAPITTEDGVDDNVEVAAKEKEALMILAVDKQVGDEVVQRLEQEEGILSVNVVYL